MCREAATQLSSLSDHLPPGVYDCSDTYCPLTDLSKVRIFAIGSELLGQDEFIEGNFMKGVI